MSQKKKKKKSPLPLIHSHSRTDTLFATGVVCILELNSSARRGFPDHQPFLLLPQLCLWTIWWGFGFFFPPPFVFLGRFVACWFGFWCSVSRAPMSSPSTPETVHRTANDLPQAAGGFPSIICRRRVASGEDGRLRCRVRSPVPQMTLQPSSTKTSSSLCRVKRGHIPSLRKDAHIALF